MTFVEPLSAPIALSFDYTRSLGPALGAFMTGLAERRIVGARTASGRVIVPPVEYDPDTHEALSDFVTVADEGAVVAWTSAPEPLDGQPLAEAFTWALVLLDGADTPMLHAVDAREVQTGLRVRARWAADRAGSIRDIVCFDPADGPATGSAGPATGSAGADAGSAGADAGSAGAGVPAAAASMPVEIAITPVSMQVQHSASPQETRYLLALQEGRVTGQRCPVCRKVYIPPRGACPVDGVPTEEEVELPDRGIVTTFCIVNVPFMGQRIQPPYVAAYVLLDGADIAFLHLILDCDASEVRMGMRVKAVWRPREEWEPSLQNITHFRPTGEPDAEYDSFKEHL